MIRPSMGNKLKFKLKAAAGLHFVPVLREMLVPLLGELGRDKSRFGRNSGLSVGRTSLGAPEPVLDSAHSTKAQLASVVGDAKIWYSRLPRLRPLAVANGLQVLGRCLDKVCV